VKILWSSPLPPIRSGVSDYAVELMAELSRLVDLRVVKPSGWESPSEWPLGENVPLVESDTEPEAGEVNLVHLGNNPHHEWLLGRLGMPETIAVLHDATLHHLLVETTVARGQYGRYEDLLTKSYGDIAKVLTRARAVGVSGRRDPFLFPALGSVLQPVSGVVVHSDWARRRIAEDLPDLECARIGLAVADPGIFDREAIRRHLGIDRQTVLLMHLGFLTTDKGMLDILTAVSTAHATGVPVHLTIVGEGRERAAIYAASESLGLSRLVSFTGWVPAREMQRLPAAADLGVVLRTPSAGETSAAAVRFFACGTPAAITGLNQFLEWPEAAAPRVTPGPSSAADLTRLLTDVANNPGGWGARRTAARATYEAQHRPKDVARQLVDALERMKCGLCPCG
jgi:glycosyltransferase involved in cell wall biosynthesis